MNIPLFLHIFFIYFLIILNPNFAQANIVFILVDDLGWADVSYHGSKIKTPNIDLLAENGIKFEKFYSSQFTSQAQSSLLTGRYPFRMGLQTGSIFSNTNYGIPEDEELLPEILSQNGFSTYFCGQWALGVNNSKYLPTNNGFKYFNGFSPLNTINSIAQERVWYENDNIIKNSIKDSFVQIKNCALNIIERNFNNDKNFLLISFPAKNNTLDKFENIEDYKNNVETLDKFIGEIHQKIDKIDNSTYIFFQSDNGGAKKTKYKTGDNDVNHNFSSNGPFLSGKGSFKEGAIRVLSFAYSKNLKSMIITTPLHVTDWFKTISSIAKINYEENKIKPLDGFDFSNYFNSNERIDPDRLILININELSASLIKKNWKLIYHSSLPNKIQLFNLLDDPIEENNIHSKNVEQTSKLMEIVQDLAWDMEDSFFYREKPLKNNIMFYDNPERP